MERMQSWVTTMLPGSGCPGSTMLWIWSFTCSRHTVEVSPCLFLSGHSFFREPGGIGHVAVTFSCVGRQGWCSGPLCALLFFKYVLLPPLPVLHVVIGTDPLCFKKLGRGLIYKIQICHTDNVDF